MVDVRSPGEFLAGHIPGAISIPLFSDEERAIVGTLYKQVSRDAAMEEGLAIAGAKMKSLLLQGKAQLSPDRKMVLHCWRGGNRSKAMEWLFRFSGMPVMRLEGGYKSYRQTLHQFFTDNPFELFILGGCTGSGKTEVLAELKAMGEQVIDLENLAHHKGSAFGSIGEAAQPTTEQFENDIYHAFLQLDPSRPVWIENESQSIGRAHLPEGLWNQMRRSRLFAIEVDQDCRLDRILHDYSQTEDVFSLKVCFEKIQKRLGGLDFKLAMEALDKHDLRTAAALALKYYDKAYRFQLANWPAPMVVHLPMCNEVPDIATQLMTAGYPSGSKQLMKETL